VVRERLRRRGVASTRTPDGSLKAAPHTALTDADRAAIRALRDEPVAVVRDAAERPARVLTLAADLGWPEVRPFVGQSVGPGEADYRRVLHSQAWRHLPDGAEHWELLLGALAGVLTHRLERAESTVDQWPAGRRHSHLRLVALPDAPAEGVRA
jgi:hypothetical protein